ncbi:MAG: Por secretion system protein, partial [Duncaniella sp.]|nr:Por secretion system protein [Duncaniella sp.]
MKLFNKFALGCGLLGMSLTAIAADGGLLAFPGAEGFGRFTTGGRGGEIYHVTNLNDAGPGSLRDAVSKEGRIIVFDVSGVIELKSALVFKGNNTILGQTAPGEGIQVYGDRVSFSNATNLIVRNMRFRMGVGGTNGADACGVANGTDMIFDHLSVLWGRDENFSVSWDNKNTRPANITIQNSIIGQGLQSHSCGGLIQTIGGVTL